MPKAFFQINTQQQVFQTYFLQNNNNKKRDSKAGHPRGNINKKTGVYLPKFWCKKKTHPVLGLEGTNTNGAQSTFSTVNENPSKCRSHGQSVRFACARETIDERRFLTARGGEVCARERKKTRWLRHAHR